MNQIVTSGIVLNRTNFGESDRILTILTPDHGRIKAIAKGVRKVKSKLAGGIELFSISHITFIKGKSEIYTLVSTRLSQHYPNIGKSLDRTMFGYDVLKLVDKTVEDNAGEEYFVLLAHALAGLNEPALPLSAVELWLNAQLLKLAGHSPNLSTDTAGHRLSQTQQYSFDPDNMAFVGRAQGHYGVNHIKLMRLALGLNSPLKLAQLKDIDAVLPTCLQLSKTMLNQFIRT